MVVLHTFHSLSRKHVFVSFELYNRCECAAQRSRLLGTTYRLSSRLFGLLPHIRRTCLETKTFHQETSLRCCIHTSPALLAPWWSCSKSAEIALHNFSMSCVRQQGAEQAKLWRAAMIAGFLCKLGVCAGCGDLMLVPYSIDRFSILPPNAAPAAASAVSDHVLLPHLLA